MTKSARLQRNQHSVAPASRVLIVDDSVVARAALSRMVEESSQFDVVAALDGARRAIDWLATQQVDIILLDVQMPGLDGIAALPELIAAGDGARVLIVSTLAGEGTRATVEALALGASDTLVKPQAGALGRHFAVLLLEKMEALAEHVRQHPATGVCGDFALRPGAEGAVECLAIGASTGGLHALANFFQALPREFDAPILVTQHLPPVFMPFFAEQLASLSKRHVRVAEDGLVLRHGEIVVAPGTRHLGCACSGRTVRTVLLDEDVPSRCRPSVDPMFAAIARGPMGRVHWAWC